MNSAYNNFVYVTKNNEEMNYYNSFENYPHQYMNYVPNNIPMLYEQNKQKNFLILLIVKYTWKIIWKRVIINQIFIELVLEVKVQEEVIIQ